MLALLATGGVRGSEALEAQRALVVHTIGSAAFAAAPPLGSGADARPLPSAVELIPTFERGLDWLLEAMAAAAHRGDR